MAAPSLKKSKNIILACETLDYTWDESQLTEAVELWNEGYTILELSKYFRRNRKEIVILLLEVLSEKQKRELFGLRWHKSIQPKRCTN